jgi:hypothetical protein
MKSSGKNGARTPGGFDPEKIAAFYQQRYHNIRKCRLY